MKNTHFYHTAFIFLVIALFCNAATGHSLTMQEIFEANNAAVVKINATYSGDLGAGSGSGFFINQFGTVLTCYHVVKDAASVKVEYKNSSYSADILYFWEEQDAAILLCHIDDTPFVNVNPGYDHLNESLPKVLDPVLVAGFPLGMGLSANEGKISSRYTLSENQSSVIVLQTDTAINPGNSGGPVFDSRGVVIGMATSKVAQEAVSGISFVYTIDWIVRRWPFIFQANAAYMQQTYGEWGIARVKPIFNWRMPLGGGFEERLGLVSERYYTNHTNQRPSSILRGYYHADVSKISFDVVSLTDLIILDIFGRRSIELFASLNPIIAELPVRRLLQTFWYPDKSTAMSAFWDKRQSILTSPSYRSYRTQKRHVERFKRKTKSLLIWFFIEQAAMYYDTLLMQESYNYSRF